ncbi:hypothetical protein J437_LFUL001605 [Ladona fulva]|uniref:DUF5641 domain-containing protein n=1 Tax=Ladona fulva TaxID=123851 RepID=A0A8K0P4Z7_LADFU|nr:hypothetical protein J437_LFUL001605 [Ladona fulva]
MAPNLMEGQLVTVKDANLQPLRWTLGNMIKVHPGKDGIARVVDLKTVQGVITRGDAGRLVDGNIVAESGHCYIHIGHIEIKSVIRFRNNAKAKDNKNDRSFKTRPLIDMVNANLRNFALFDELREKGIRATGMIRENRMGKCTLMSAKELEKFPRGYNDYRF